MSRTIVKIGLSDSIRSLFVNSLSIVEYAYLGEKWARLVFGPKHLTALRQKKEIWKFQNVTPR